MNSGSFLKPRSGGSRGGKKELRKSRWLKYILAQQQIQLMTNEDNGSLVFFKLKNIFFEEHLDEEQIASIIRDSPIKVIDKILTKITDYYNTKVEEIVEILEDQKQALVNQLSQNREKLHHSLEDNEFFKMMIDKLEEEKKDVEIRLNQSESQIEKTTQECDFITGENNKFKYSVVELYQTNQVLQTENSQLIDNTLLIQRQMEALKNYSLQLKLDYNELYLSRKELAVQFQALDYDLNRIKEENQILSQKLHTKEDFIASFINQYNKIHFFQHRDPFTESDRKISTIFEGSHELKGFNFNQFDKDSVIYEKTSKHDTSYSVQDIEIDSKFAHVSATAEKPKSLASKAKLCESEEKPEKSPRQQLQSTQVGNPQKNSLKYSFNTRIDKLVEKQNESGGSLTKAISSKNYNLNQSSILPEAEGSKLNLEEALRKKVMQKSARINRLESEVFTLRAQYIQEREKITEMQGEYEISIEELKEDLQRRKLQFNSLYQKYVLSNSQLQVYKQKVTELEQLIKESEQEHTYYCEQLRQKCKAYVIKRIDQVEQHYYNFTCSRKSPQNSPYSEHSLQEVEESDQEYVQEIESVREGSLKLRSVDQVDSPEERKIEGSDSYSYRHLSNHHINSLHLNLDFSRTQNMTSEKGVTDEVYIRDNFQIESDLGAFTQRLKQQQSEHRERGNLTSREGKIISSQKQFVSRLKYLSLRAQILEIQITSSRKALHFHKGESINIDSREKTIILDPLKPVSDKMSQKMFEVYSKVCEFHHKLQNRPLKIFQTESVSFTLREEQNRLRRSQTETFERGRDSNCEVNSKKCMIYSFQIFESGSTLNTTQQINRSWLKHDCNSFLMNTDEKVEENNNTFILEEEESQNKVKISSFGVHQRFTQQSNELNLQNIVEESSYQILDQESKQSKIAKNNDESWDERRQQDSQSEFIDIKNSFKLQDPSFSIGGTQIEKIAEKQSLQNVKTKEDNVQVNHQRNQCQLEQLKRKDIWKTEKITKTSPFNKGNIPKLLKERLNQTAYNNLTNFLKKNLLFLKTSNLDESSSSMESRFGKNILCICLGEQKRNQRTFVINEKRLFCLEDETWIKGQNMKIIQDKAMMFGQSEVILTDERELIINRDGKLNKLSGNIPDGTWRIKEFIRCKYTVTG